MIWWWGNAFFKKSQILVLLQLFDTLSGLSFYPSYYRGRYTSYRPLSLNYQRYWPAYYDYYPTIDYSYSYPRYYNYWPSWRYYLDSWSPKRSYYWLKYLPLSYLNGLSSNYAEYLRSVSISSFYFGELQTRGTRYRYWWWFFFYSNLLIQCNLQITNTLCILCFKGYTNINNSFNTKHYVLLLCICQNAWFRSISRTFSDFWWWNEGYPGSDGVSFDKNP